MNGWRKLLVLLSVGVAASSCSSSEAVDVVQLSTTTSSDAEAAAVETTTTTEATTTTTTTPPDRVNSGEEAAAWVVDYADAYSEYLSDALVGDGARLSDLEDALEFQASGRQVDSLALHECLMEDLLMARTFFDTAGGEFEASFDVAQVLELEPGLWIVEGRRTTFVTGLGEQIEENGVYVSSDGLIGGRPQPDEDPSEPDCFDQAAATTPETQALLDRAAELDPEG